MIIIKEKDKNINELEPYKKFNDEYQNAINNSEGEDDDITISFVIDKKKDGFSQGFHFDKEYFKSIKLIFHIVKNIQAQNENEEWLINHALEYDINPAYAYTHIISLKKIQKAADYLFITGASYSEFSQKLKDESALMIFDVLTSKSQIEDVCKQLISYDIALLCRGW